MAVCCVSHGNYTNRRAGNCSDGIHLVRRNMPLYPWALGIGVDECRGHGHVAVHFVEMCVANSHSTETQYIPICVSNIQEKDE